mgnify:CR=1 FL=1
MTRSSLAAADEIVGGAEIASGDDELWYTRCPIPTAFEVAIGTGLFDEEFGDGAVDWFALTDSADEAVHRSHFTHRKANSFRHGGNVPAIYARAEGADTRVIGASWLRTRYTILTLPGSGIESPADLRGARVLVPRRPGADIDFWSASTLGVLESALATAGLGLGDVELVDREGEEDLIPGASDASVEARLRWTLENAARIQRDVLVPLVRGDVDAVTSQASLSEQLRALTGARVVFDQADHPDLIGRVNNGYPDLLTVSAGLLRDHPERVDRVVARLLQAETWARRNRRAAFDLLGHRIQVPGALLAATWGEDIGGHLELTLPDTLTGVLEHQRDHLLRHGYISRGFDVAAWIDPAPLARAREIAWAEGWLEAGDA